MFNGANFFKTLCFYIVLSKPSAHTRCLLFEFALRAKVMDTIVKSKDRCSFAVHKRSLFLKMKCFAIRFPFVMLLLLMLTGVQAQQRTKPKLIVGLVVDQMRWDYLYRYADRYGSGGFKRLQREGFSCDNTFIPYTPTVTAAGHTSIYTGSVPALHGIMGNNWYSRASKRVVYCTDDSTVQSVGSKSVAGNMSPRNLWSTTITDELRLAQNFRNKTVAIAIKDRGAILPGGHTANAAYWFDASVGGFISSTFYMQNLPAWVTAFNARKLPDAYLKQPWNTLYPLATYVQSTADSQVYENNILGEDNTFPHRTDAVTANKYETFKFIPAANTFTLDMAKAAIEGEGLGTHDVTIFGRQPVVYRLPGAHHRPQFH